MIQTSTGSSRASEILAKLEAKRREKIDTIVETQRLALREDLLKGIDEDHDEFLEKGNKIIKQISSAEKELDAVRKEVSDYTKTAKSELVSTKKQIDTAVKKINEEIERLVERADRLRTLNDREEEDYKNQIEQEKIRLKLIERQKELQAEVISITNEMKEVRAKKGKLSPELQARAVESYKNYQNTEAAIDTLNKKAGKNPGSILAMLDQRIAEMREAHTLSIESSKQAANDLTALLLKAAEFEFTTSKKRDELYEAALTEIVSRGLTEFFFTK